ncbi:MAG: hypothetical protein ABL953_12735 [Ilumatobacteraceae bacterium]
MRKFIGVAALVASFVLVASPAANADTPPVLILHIGNGLGPTIADGAAAPAFATTTVGTPVEIEYMFDTVGTSPPVEVITAADATAPAGFTVTQDVDAQGLPWPAGATRSWILRCDAALAGTYAGTVTVNYSTESVSPPGTGTGSFTFTVSCQVNALTTTPTTGPGIIPATGSSSTVPITALLMVGIGAVAIRLARRQQPLNTRN